MNHHTQIKIVIADLIRYPTKQSLELADFPVLIRTLREFPELKGEIPRLMVTREIGPKGWNKAILDILGKKEEERNA